VNAATPSDARALIEGYLGRPVQDALEAAVVLEAWGGVPADAALALGGDAAAESATVGPVADEAPLPPTFDRRAVLSDVAFIVAVLFVGFWLSRRTDRFAVVDIDRAWRLALPVSLAAQWFLRRRVFMGGDGLGRLRRETWLLVPAAALLGGLAVVPSGGPLAAGLAVLWIAGFVVSRRGWGVPYGLLLASTLLAGGSARAALPTYVFVCVGTLCAAILALRTSPVSDRLPGALGRAIPSALVGGGMGMFLVSEPRFSWAASGMLSAFTIVPSLLGSLAGGIWMTRLWQALPSSLCATGIADRSARSVAGPAIRLFLQAIALVLFVTTTCSLVVLWRDGAPFRSETSATTRTLLLAHAALALAGLCVALLETLGRWGRALFATAVGAFAAFTLSAFSAGEPRAGLRIFVGALVALVLALPGVLALLARPDHRIAAVT
jgi:hypothetical protein